MRFEGYVDIRRTWYPRRIDSRASEDINRAIVMEINLTDKN
jgi:hypothetical protein